MKSKHFKLISPVVASLLSVILASHAFAVTPVTPVTKYAETTKYGLGIATSSLLTDSDSSISAAIQSDSDLIQVYLAVPTVDPFRIALAGAYKINVAEQGAAGFHLGAAAAIGVGQAYSATGGVVRSTATQSDTSIYFKLGGILGAHVPFPGYANMLLSFDGGPMVHLQSNHMDFSIGALSSVLGVSLLYFF